MPKKKNNTTTRRRKWKEIGLDIGFVGRRERQGVGRRQQPVGAQLENSIEILMDIGALTF